MRNRVKSKRNLDAATLEINVDVNCALDSLVHCLKSTSECRPGPVHETALAASIVWLYMVDIHDIDSWIL